MTLEIVVIAFLLGLSAGQYLGGPGRRNSRHR